MSSLIARVTARLRESILDGSLQPGERIVELAYAASLGVSRTPLRLALAELAREGLVEGQPSRGYRVRAVSLADVVDAIEVRGVLEGLAARLVAERGLDAAARGALGEAVADGRAVLERARREPGAEVDALAWREANARFHAALVGAAGNGALVAAVAHNNRTPLSAPGAITLLPERTPLARDFLERAQQDHEDLLAAIDARQSTRAEALMREHAWRSRAYRSASMRAGGDGRAAPPGDGTGAASTTGGSPDAREGRARCRP